MDIVKVSWSGGKDSSCALKMHIDRGDEVKAICYIPMFTDEIPLISAEHYDFITNTAQRFREMGARVDIVSGMTFYDYFYHVKTKGQNKGKIMAFPPPITRMCPFRNYSKEKALDKHDLGEYDYESIAIAYDEIKRHGQLNERKRSILVEEKITENMATDFCQMHNILSPHYNYDKRDGCAICPHAKRERLERWLAEFPEAKAILIKMQDDAKLQYPGRSPLRNGGWYIDTDQVTIFDI